MRLERTIHRRGGRKGTWSREGRPSCPHSQPRKEGDRAMLKMDNQQRPTGQHREPCSMLCGSLAGRGTGKKGYMYVYGWVPSLCTWNITTLLISYTPLQNHKFKRKKRCWRPSFLQGNSCLTHRNAAKTRTFYPQSSLSFSPWWVGTMVVGAWIRIELL